MLLKSHTICQVQQRKCCLVTSSSMFFVFTSLAPSHKLLCPLQITRIACFASAAIAQTVTTALTGSTRLDNVLVRSYCAERAWTWAQALQRKYQETSSICREGLSAVIVVLGRSCRCFTFSQDVGTRLHLRRVSRSCRCNC